MSCVHRRGFKEDQVGNVVGALGQRLRLRVESQRRAAFEAARQPFEHLQVGRVVYAGRSCLLLRKGIAQSVLDGRESLFQILAERFD